eukprot:scaffold109216_cov35-Tisochrysis_lutea.AAC.1
MASAPSPRPVASRPLVARSTQQTSQHPHWITLSCSVAMVHSEKQLTQVGSRAAAAPGRLDMRSERSYGEREQGQSRLLPFLLPRFLSPFLVFSLALELESKVE